MKKNTLFKLSIFFMIFTSCNKENDVVTQETYVPVIINSDWFRKQEADPNSLLKMTTPENTNSPVLYSKGSIEQEIERLLS
jgi:hypothetical protein